MLRRAGKAGNRATPELARLGGASGMQGRGSRRCLPVVLLALIALPVAAPVAAMGRRQVGWSDAVATHVSAAIQPPLSGMIPPAPPGQGPLAPLAGGLAVLAVALAAVAVWNHPRRPGARRSVEPSSSLLPQPRRGASPHEQLHDARYLGRILKAELNGSEQLGEVNQAAPRAPLEPDSNKATPADQGKP